VLLLLIRHGHAGTKEGWAGDDGLRPLDSRGRRQAEHLAVVAVDFGPTRLLSSPYLRCLQTMEPIAAKTGLAVEEADALTPNAGPRAVTLVRELSGAGPESRFVLCTHGEVIGEALATLASTDGVRLRRRPPGPKGCAWLLDFREGKMATAQYISPRR
jgi:phosphohistidine phosphatase SixA